MTTTNSVTIPQVEKNVFLIRGEKVILDTDLATLYGVKTKALNQAIKRNKKRFPDDFLFQISKLEKDKLVTICDRFQNLKHSTSLPYAFTEHGAIMAATVLNSQRAIDVSVYVVRAFVKLRETLSDHRQIARKLNLLENKVVNHDIQIKALFDAIRQLMDPPVKKKRSIGFERN
ncbi:MAG: ORF6N domain-containing protein [bacterium]|nr:ORF6N domain-containing protein [bacterium]MBU1917787.1 ORF6N domain-containing protein [bacterium]